MAVEQGPDHIDPTVAAYQRLRTVVDKSPEHTEARLMLGGVDAITQAVHASMGLPIVTRAMRGADIHQDNSTVKDYPGDAPRLVVSIEGPDGFTQTADVRVAAENGSHGPKHIIYKKEFKGKVVIEEVGTQAANVGVDLVADRLKAPPRLPGL